MTTTTSGRFRYRGTDVRFNVRGSGQPLLLNNGIGASLEVFNPVRDRLDDRMTIAWDAPGAGETGIPLGCPSFRAVIGAQRALLDHLGLDQIDLFGVSWGGGVAQEFTLRHPERVRRLILAATSTGWTSRPGDLKILPIMLDNRRFTSPRYMRLVAPRVYGGDLVERPELLDGHALDRLEGRSSMRGYIWQLMASSGWTSRWRLNRISQPTLIMAGDRDPLIHISAAKTMDRLIPNSQLRIFEGGGHLFMLTRLDESVAEIRAFLDQPATNANASTAA